jgi:hypothetical protein
MNTRNFVAVSLMLVLGSIVWAQTPTCQGNQATGKTVTLPDFTLAQPGDSLFFFATSLAGKNSTTAIAGADQDYLQIGGPTFYAVALTGSAAEFLVTSATGEVQGATITDTWTGAPPTGLIGCEMPGTAVVVGTPLISIGTGARSMDSGQITIADDGLYYATYCVGGGATKLTSWSTSTAGFGVIGTSQHSGCFGGWIQGPATVEVVANYTPDLILHASGILTLFQIGQL